MRAQNIVWKAEVRASKSHRKIVSNRKLPLFLCELMVSQPQMLRGIDRN